MICEETQTVRPPAASECNMTDGEIVEIYRAKNEPDAMLMESALREHGIECRLVGQYLAGAVGEIPAGIASSPALWVNIADAERARNLVSQLQRSSNQKATADPAYAIDSWQCPKCDTTVESQFEMCWNCLYSRVSC